MKSIKDSDGNKTTAGDKVRFTYGIPPVLVIGDVIERNSSLIVLTPGHSPSECNLRSLKRYVGEWFRESP
jgi:hypothetical protein